MLGEQAGLLRLQVQVAVPDDLDGGGRVPALPQGGGDDLVDGALQLPVDLRHPGQLGADLPAPALLLLLPLAAALGQALGGPAEHGGLVSHGLSPLLVLSAQEFPHPGHVLPHPAVGVPGPGGMVLHGGTGAPAAGGVPRLDLRQSM